MKLLPLLLAAILDNLASYTTQGYDQVATAAGESYVPRTLDGSKAPAMGPKRKRAER